MVKLIELEPPELHEIICKREWLREFCEEIGIEMEVD